MSACTEHRDCNLWDTQDKAPVMHVPSRCTVATLTRALEKGRSKMTLAERIDGLYDALDAGMAKFPALRSVGLVGHARWEKYGLLAHASWLEEQEHSVEESA